MSFYSEKTVKAVKAVRKAHRCEGCSRAIEVGQPAFRVAGVIDGDFCALTYHPECREAEVALNADWRDGDDWYCLLELDLQDRAWLVEEHPAAAARLGLHPAALSPASEEGE